MRGLARGGVPVPTLGHFTPLRVIIAPRSRPSMGFVHVGGTGRPARARRGPGWVGPGGAACDRVGGRRGRAAGADAACGQGRPAQVAGSRGPAPVVPAVSPNVRVAGVSAPLPQTVLSRARFHPSVGRRGLTQDPSGHDKGRADRWGDQEEFSDQGHWSAGRSRTSNRGCPEAGSGSDDPRLPMVLCVLSSRALPAGRGGLDRVVVRRPEVDRRPSVDRLDDRDLTGVIGLVEHVPQEQ